MIIDNQLLDSIIMIQHIFDLFVGLIKYIVVLFSHHNLYTP